MDNNYFFEQSSTSDGWQTVCITESSYWTENECMADRTPQELFKFMGTLEAYELQEGEFECQDIEATMIALSDHPNFHKDEAFSSLIKECEKEDG
jgi:hypothetical protein